MLVFEVHLHHLSFILKKPVFEKFPKINFGRLDDSLDHHDRLLWCPWLPRSAVGHCGGPAGRCRGFPYPLEPTGRTSPWTSPDSEILGKAWFWEEKTMKFQWFFRVSIFYRPFSSEPSDGEHVSRFWDIFRNNLILRKCEFRMVLLAFFSIFHEFSWISWIFKLGRILIFGKHTPETFFSAWFGEKQHSS